VTLQWGIEPVRLSHGVLEGSQALLCVTCCAAADQASVHRATNYSIDQGRCSLTPANSLIAFAEDGLAALLLLLLLFLRPASGKEEEGLRLPRGRRALSRPPVSGCVIIDRCNTVWCKAYAWWRCQPPPLPSTSHPNSSTPTALLLRLHLPLQVRRWTRPKRLASAGRASESILDCDRIIVPVRARCRRDGNRCIVRRFDAPQRTLSSMLCVFTI